MVMVLSLTFNEKYEKLKKIIQNLKRVVVAFSGGVDSSLLLRVSRNVLGKQNVLAFIGNFPAFPERELESAKNLAEEMDCIYEIVETGQLDDPDFLKNDSNRCYYCKRQLMEKARSIADAYNFDYVIEGSNIDDLEDYRPGMKACDELDIISPLLEAGLSKREIRELSKMLFLPTYNKPSFSCLATRIPHETPIKKEILKLIDRSEDYIKELGIKDVRVRYHGSIARIEVKEDEMIKLIENRQYIAETLISYGFFYVTLDLKGYHRSN